MPADLQIERDTDGLQMAVRELFEETFFDEAQKGLLAKIGDDAEQREYVLSTRPTRSLSPGYYDRASYALDLGAAMETGVGFTAMQLSHSDVTALQAVKRAKAAFEHDHPSCPACGVRQDNRFLFQCKACQTKFAGRGQ